MPVNGATTAKVATRTTATRLAIVIDSMSETAAKTMQNGKDDENQRLRAWRSHPSRSQLTASTTAH